MADEGSESRFRLDTTASFPGTVTRLIVVFFIYFIVGGFVLLSKQMTLLFLIGAAIYVLLGGRKR